MTPWQLIDDWAAVKHVTFVNRSGGPCTTDTVSRDALVALVTEAIDVGVKKAHGSGYARQLEKELNRVRCEREIMGAMAKRRGQRLKLLGLDAECSIEDVIAICNQLGIKA